MRRAVFILLMGLLLFSCRQGEKPVETPAGKPSPEIEIKGEKPILEIAGKTYPLSDFTGFLEVKGLKPSELDDITKSRLFDSYVDNRILIAEAERKKVFVTSNELASYRQRLEQMGVKLNERMIKAIYDDLLVKKFLSLLAKDIQVSDSEALTYYKMHIEEFKVPEEVKVRQIVVPTEEEAIKILNKLKKSPPSAFAKIAREKSIGPEASRGGLMGYFRKGDLPMEMEEVIFNLSVGQLSQVVKTAYGYHIFRVEEKRPPRTIPFSAVKERIKEKIKERKLKKKVDELLKRLRKELQVKIYYENLDFQYKKEEGIEETAF